MLNKTFDADGKPAPILETPRRQLVKNKLTRLPRWVFAADEAKYAETDLAVEELLTEGIFDLWMRRDMYWLLVPLNGFWLINANGRHVLCCALICG